MNLETGNHRELDPETEVLLGLNSTENDASFSPETAEKKPGTFEDDIADFKYMLDNWQKQFDGQLIPFAKDVPDGYKILTNIKYSPYDTYLNQYLELLHRGAPILLCKEAKTAAGVELIEDDISVYVKTELHKDFTDLMVLDINKSAPQTRLTVDINTWGIHAKLFDEHQRIDPDKLNELLQSEVLWAEEHGIVRSAFMTSFLLKNTDPTYLAYIHGLDGYGSNRLSQIWSDDYHLYNQFAAEIDKHGNRKNMPLSIEQFGLLSIASMIEVFQENPGLNERLQLERPFAVVPNQNSL